MSALIFAVEYLRVRTLFAVKRLYGRYDYRDLVPLFARDLDSGWVFPSREIGIGAGI